MNYFAVIRGAQLLSGSLPSFLAHLSRSDKVSFCDRSLSVVRPLTIDLNDNSS